MCPICHHELKPRRRRDRKRKHQLRCDGCRRVFWINGQRRLAGFPTWDSILGELVALPRPAVTVWR